MSKANYFSIGVDAAWDALYLFFPFTQRKEKF
jgi:hypothetical protein